MACLSLFLLKNKKSYVLVGAFLLLTIMLCIGIFVKHDRKQPLTQPTSQYLIEIGVENHSSHHLEAVQFGVVNEVGEEFLLDDLHYETWEAEDPSFWISYHKDTLFFLKVETDIGYGRVDFDLHGKENTDHPQKKTFFVTEEDGGISISAEPDLPLRASAQ